MLRYLKYGFILSTCALTSCSAIYGHNGLIQNRGTDYLTATNIAPLKIPLGISSSTIEAHYPVSEKDYPETKKTVKLIPPDLSLAHPATKETVVTQQQTAQTNPATQGFVSPEVDPQTLSPAQQQQAEAHYYDPYTRSTTGGVGKPIASVLNKVWPGKKAPTQPGSSSKNAKPEPALFGNPATSPADTAGSRSVNAPVASTQTAAPEAKQSPTVAGKSFGSMVKSLWPWGKKSAEAPATNTATAPQTASTATAPGPQVASAATIPGSAPTKSNSNVNDPSNSSAQTSKMAEMYFDRFTRR